MEILLSVFIFICKHCDLWVCFVLFFPFSASEAMGHLEAAVCLSAGWGKAAGPLTSKNLADMPLRLWEMLSEGQVAGSELCVCVSPKKVVYT